MDTILIENANTLGPLPPSKQLARTYSPILENEDSTIGSTKILENPKTSNLKKIDATNTSKASLKGSKVSFEQPNASSDEDSFEERREHFQQKKSLSATDPKGILKVSL